MRKKIRLLLVIAVLMLLAAGWTWRYVTLNQYYDALDNGDVRLYQSGELVPFENDGNDKDTNLNGYYIRVDDYEIRDYQEYLDDTGISIPEDTSVPDKLVLITVTLINESCETNPVMVSDMVLHGVDFLTKMDWDVLLKANPILEGNTGIALNPGTECELILPYTLYKHQFKYSTWRNIDECELFLQVTCTLTTKEIQING